MNVQDTFESVLKGYVVHMASSNQYLRQLLARDLSKDEAQAKQVLEQVEQGIKNDIVQAQEQLPAFLKGLDIPVDTTALRDLHIGALYSAVKADAEQIAANLAKHFLPPQEVTAKPDLKVVPVMDERGTPPPPPPAPPEPTVE